MQSDINIVFQENPNNIQLTFSGVCESFEEGRERVTKISGISYGKEITKDPLVFVNEVRKLKHDSCFEHAWYDLIIPINPKALMLETNTFNIELGTEMSDILPFLYGQDISNFDYIRIFGNVRRIMELNDILDKEETNIGEPDSLYVGSQVQKHLQSFIDSFFNDKNDFNGIINKKEIGKNDVYTFKVITDRAILNQMVRHRTLSFIQESMRRINFEEGFTFIMMGNDYHKLSLSQRSELCSFLDSARILYKELFRHSNLKKEVARNVLPLGIQTQGYITGNLDNWNSFFGKRIKRDAQPAIYYIAEKIKEQIIKEKVNINDSSREGNNT